MSRRWMVCVLFAIAVLAAVAGARPQGGYDLYQQALSKERAEGKLAEAIALYERVVRESGSDRPLAAKALLRLGECHEKLGDTESRKAYERLVRDFADQKDVAEQARARLSAMAAGSPAARSSASSRMLWTAPRHATLDSVSPDGRLVAWTEWSDDGNSSNMVVHDLVSGSDRRLTNVGPMEGVGLAVFSRDGKSLAYNWHDTMGGAPAALQIVSLAGTGVPPARQLLADKGFSWIQPFDWTPDGKWVAVALTLADRSYQIALVSADNGTVRPFAFTPQAAVDRMALSPDGQWLALDALARNGRGRDIVILRADGTGETKGATQQANAALVGWTPDGSRLLFTSDRLGTNSLFAQPLAQGRLQGKPMLIKADIGQFIPLGVGTSGTLYSSVDNNWEGSDVRVGAFDFSGGRWITPAADAVQESAGGAARKPALFPTPDWSPDGRSFSFVTGRGPQYVVNSNPAIVIRSLETNALRELRPKLASLMGAAIWAPDGSALASAGRDFSARWGIYRIDAGTGDVSAVAFGGNGGKTIVYLLGWSRDASRIYFRRLSDDKPPQMQTFEKNLVTGVERELFKSSDWQSITRMSDDGRRLYFRQGLPRDGKPPYQEYALIERDLESGSEREIARGVFTGSVQVSPDMRFVAYATGDATSTTIRLALTAGGQSRDAMRAERTSGAAPASSPGAPALDVLCWAPDSQSVLVKKRTGPDRPVETWWVPVDGRDPARMDDGSDGEMSHIRVHPDGRRVALVLQKPREFKPYEVWALENVLLHKK